jgi:hypothetical protein
VRKPDAFHLRRGVFAKRRKNNNEGKNDADHDVDMARQNAGINTHEPFEIFTVAHWHKVTFLIRTC